jgi:hypothetical protein
MTLTRKIFAAAVVALAAFTFTAPALAQPGGYDHSYEQRDERQGRWGDTRMNHEHGPDRARQAVLRIDAGLRSGRLTSREAWRLRDDLGDLARLEIRLRRDGLPGRDRKRLDHHWDDLMAEIRDQSRDRQYGYGYGWRR